MKIYISFLTKLLLTVKSHQIIKDAFRSWIPSGTPSFDFDTSDLQRGVNATWDKARSSVNLLHYEHYFLRNLFTKNHYYSSIFFFIGYKIQCYQKLFIWKQKCKFLRVLFLKEKQILILFSQKKNICLHIKLPDTPP